MTPLISNINMSTASPDPQGEGFEDLSVADYLVITVAIVTGVTMMAAYVYAMFKMRAVCRDRTRRERINNAAPFRYRMLQYIRAEEREQRARRLDRRLWLAAQSVCGRRPRGRGRGRGRARAHNLEDPEQPAALQSPPRSYRSRTHRPRRERTPSPPPRYTLEDEEAYVQSLREPRTSLEVLLPAHLRTRAHVSLLAADEEDQYPLPPPSDYGTPDLGSPPAYDYIENHIQPTASADEQRHDTAAGSILGSWVVWVVGGRDARQEEVGTSSGRGRDEEEGASRG